MRPEYTVCIFEVITTLIGIFSLTTSSIMLYKELYWRDNAPKSKYFHEILKNMGPVERQTFLSRYSFNQMLTVGFIAPIVVHLLIHTFFTFKQKFPDDYDDEELETPDEDPEYLTSSSIDIEIAQNQLNFNKMHETDSAVEVPSTNTMENLTGSTTQHSDNVPIPKELKQLKNVTYIDQQQQNAPGNVKVKFADTFIIPEEVKRDKNLIPKPAGTNQNEQIAKTRNAQTTNMTTITNLETHSVTGLDKSWNVKANKDTLLKKTNPQNNLKSKSLENLFSNKKGYSGDGAGNRTQNQLTEQQLTKQDTLDNALLEGLMNDENDALTMNKNPKGGFFNSNENSFTTAPNTIVNSYEDVLDQDLRARSDDIPTELVPVDENSISSPRMCKPILMTAILFESFLSISAFYITITTTATTEYWEGCKSPINDVYQDGGCKILQYCHNGQGLSNDTLLKVKNSLYICPDSRLKVWAGVSFLLLGISGVLTAIAIYYKFGETLGFTASSRYKDSRKRRARKHSSLMSYMKAAAEETSSEKISAHRLNGRGTDIMVYHQHTRDRFYNPSSTFAS